MKLVDPPLPPKKPSRLAPPKKGRPWTLPIAALAVMLAGGLCAWLLYTPVKPAVAAQPSAHHFGTTVVALHQTKAIVPPPHLIKPDPKTVGSALAADLNTPSGTGVRDVQTLQSLIRLYFRRLHGRQGPPIGNDSDLSRALTGRNPLKVVILPPSNSAVGSDGRLHDRWGTAYFIHPLGHNQFDIRSAGPDRKMFTKDDIIADPSWTEDAPE